MAYVVPPLLAFVLGFIGLTQVSEAGLVGASSTVTAAAGSETGSNQRVAAALERIARAEDATIVRVVADRSAPTIRRVALVTDAPASRGESWLRDGYADFSSAMTTDVRPMADLDQFDPTGTYDVFGDERARRATIDALTGVGYDVTSERTPLLRRVGIADGVNGALGLIAALTLGSSVLCLMGTVGSPRRCAVRRLHGRGTASILLVELAETRTALLIVAIAAPCAAIGLAFHNGLADVMTFGAAVAILCAALLAPLIATHAVGTLVACRRPMAEALRAHGHLGRSWSRSKEHASRRSSCSSRRRSTSSGPSPSFDQAALSATCGPPGKRSSFGSPRTHAQWTRNRTGTGSASSRDVLSTTETRFSQHLSRCPRGTAGAWHPRCSWTPATCSCRTSARRTALVSPTLAEA
ncbi:hypothetical protein P9139_05865 [Curtobacterium flaccumfaciens]|nr:hypothetical protein P9139_05865 [Curtobacterium flaccumfaciens]